MHSQGSLDRGHTVDGILDAVTRPLGPPLIAMVGPCGIGLSTTLDEIRAALHERGAHVVTMQFTRNSSDLPGPLGAPRLPAASELLAKDNAALLVDDAQWVDGETLGRLESLVRKLVGTRARCVCAIRLTAPPAPGSAGQAVLSQLVHEGLAEIVHLRPLGDAELAALMSERFGAKPSPELVRHLRRLTRNRPKALTTALEAYQRSNAIRVVDRHAYLAHPDVTPALPDNHELPLYVRRMGNAAWTVAKAMAVLNPLGDAAVRLAAETTGLTESEVDAALDLLRSQGILRHLAGTGRWVFRLPLVEAVLIDQLGPYERRRLAQAAVTAVWDGRARCEDPDYLADQLVNAGRMVDGERARTELLARVRETNGAGRVETWLRAAADLTPDRAQRAAILLEHAGVCAVRGKVAECLETTHTLLHDLPDQLPPDLLQDVHLAHVTALHATGDFATTEQIACGEWWPWAGRPVERVVTRAAALSLLGRWQQARDLLAGTEHVWRGCPTAVHHATVLGSLAGLWLGDRDQFDRGLAALCECGADDRRRQRQMTHYVGALLAIGDRQGAERLLAEDSRPPEWSRLAEQAVLAARRGRFDAAVEFTRTRIVRGPSFGYGPVAVAMVQAAAVIHLARGRITRARELLAGGRSTHPVLPHVLAGPEAWIATMLGEHQRARATVREALDTADRDGVLAGTDELWFAAFKLAHAEGDLADARSCLHRAEAVVDGLGTVRAEIYRLLIRAALEPGSGFGAEALRLARELSEPLQLVTTIEHVVQVDAAEPHLLTEAYEILGGLDALLLRAWSRTLMRKHNIAVPGRQSTVAENERLLAVLVAEGLGNKQLATVLRASEKSVEGRLSRLFSRTGYRSRVELAVAILNGEFEV
ncbi:LuxR C-terminal-related transcriptional regulator [Kutzneria kofuensis]|uniref:LuxR C-terminal-related transcriptional regulator n=1 Tax=Kutzneria kofuensis TaxID=103725 RepID=UPI0031E9F8D3